MKITPYHVKYYAHELIKRNPSNSLEKFGAALQDAKVDLNPHQVEAALFAFNSPLSKGAILADEVGLGKTIEAGILLSQSWAVGQKKLLVIGPSSLRKQWSQELVDKFYLPSIIMESKNFKASQGSGKHNPFDQNKIVICSYHFAKNQVDYIQQIDWDLVVMDEAHRLRNVYKSSNKIGRALQKATYHCKKVLLTATPLQNSLMELYGLVSIIDEHVFGDKDSFRSQFTRLDGEYEFKELRDRIAPVCMRTLRRQVQEYVRYTSRIPMTLQFEPTEQEQMLYDQVSAYLQRRLLWALPSNQRHLLTLVMRKLLASSSFAISATLQSLISRLEKLVNENQRPIDLDQELSEDFEGLNELFDDWDKLQEIEEYELTLQELEGVKAELAELHRYSDLAISIEHNSKGEQLLVAIQKGFEKLKSLGAAQKTIIFTESRRTQEYIYRKLQQTEYAGKVVLFNGVNNDQQAKKVFKSWLSKNAGTDKITGSRTADKRQALVDYFREEAQIMIATEAAAEGINLQFCSMLINYDLPWNPQRVEQRIGRCHRYGQQFDVVVVNFINQRNAADVRVFQLLDEKFQLFSGVFGASDEILGAVESGVDFEKKIAEIYQRCRTTEEINKSFDELQTELQEQIEHKMKTAREQLMENFDAAVLEKLKLRLDESRQYIGILENWLWLITKYLLQKDAEFNDELLEFTLRHNPFSSQLNLGTYTLLKTEERMMRYRINHPLAQAVLKQASDLSTPVAKLTFNLSSHPVQVNAFERLKGQSGILRLTKVEVHSFDVTDHLLFTALSDEGEVLEPEVARRMFQLAGFSKEDELDYEEVEALCETEKQQLSELAIELKQKDAQYFNHEVQKLNRWAEDRIYVAEKELRDLKKNIREWNNEAKVKTKPEEQLDIQKKLRDLNRKQRVKRQRIFEIEEQIEKQRDNMIDQIEERMQRQMKKDEIFSVRWSIL